MSTAPDPTADPRRSRFTGTSELARKVLANRRAVIASIEDAGGSEPRIFGSLADGTDQPDSDIDILFEAGDRLSLMGLVELELRLSTLLEAPVDLVPEESVRPGIRDRVRRQAVPL